MTTALDTLAAGEVSQGTFDFYVLMLIVSGILLIVVGAIGFGQSAGMRALDAVIGLGFLGYGGYLALLYDGGSFLMLYYAFVAPLFLIFQAFKSWRARGQTT